MDSDSHNPAADDLRWETIESESLLDCKIFDVRRERLRRNDTEDDFFVLTTRDWVNIIPITPTGEVVLIEQYRYGTRTVTLEIPGGIMNDGETPLESARREMIEETGYDSDDVVSIGFNEPNPAFLRNVCYSFLARQVEPMHLQKFDEHENIRVRLVPLRDVPQLIRDGTIAHSLVVVAFHALALRPELIPSHILY